MFVFAAESFRSYKLALQKLRAGAVMSGTGYHLKRSHDAGKASTFPGTAHHQDSSFPVLHGGGTNIPDQPLRHIPANRRSQPAQKQVDKRK